MTLRAFTLPVALTVLAFPTFAHAAAADAPGNATGYSYEFEVDFLDGDDLVGDGPRITVRHGHARVLLIRPRTSFKPELLKTLEAF